MTFTYLNAPEARDWLARNADLFYVLHHREGHYPAVEYIPLCPPQQALDGGMGALFMDMDGTTTTTESLGILSMERVLKAILPPDRADTSESVISSEDQGALIGHNLTTNLRYVHRIYGPDFQGAPLLKTWLDAAAWLSEHSIDPKIQRQTLADLQHFGMGNAAQILASLHGGSAAQDPAWIAFAHSAPEQFLRPFEHISREDWVRVGAALYYRQYHALLRNIAAGKSDVPDSPIRPLPGVGFWQALVKGLLSPEDARCCASWLGLPSPLDDGAKEKLCRLAAYFQSQGVKVALVTSSLRAEADIVLTEMFRVLRHEIRAAAWPRPLKEKLLACYAAPLEHYDAIVTADDVHEDRLKPHRDLYAIALARTGFAGNGAGTVLGLEDTEAGVVALRAAGIGMACALPFEGTVQQNFDGAAAVCMGGLPQLILDHGAFLPGALLHRKGDAV